MSATQTHILYRFYNTDGALLYIGRTADPSSRFREHSRRQTWWTEVTDIKLQAFTTAGLLADAEREAIVNELPRYNTQLNPTVTRKRRADWGRDTLRSVTRKQEAPLPKPLPNPISHTDLVVDDAWHRFSAAAATPAPRVAPARRKQRRQRKQRQIRCAKCGQSMDVMSAVAERGRCFHRKCVDANPLVCNESHSHAVVHAAIHPGEQGALW